MAPLQFQPYISQPTPEFWSAVTSLKLDKLKLDDSSLAIQAWVEEGRSIPNLNKLTGVKEGKSVGVDGSVVLSATAFEPLSERTASHGYHLRGTFKNYNTIEEFRSPEAKKAVFDKVADDILASFDSEEPVFNDFLLLTFADLKKYTFHYWFAFPAVVSKPGWQTDGSFSGVSDIVRLLRSTVADTARRRMRYAAWERNLRTKAPKSLFWGASNTAFHDPSSLPDNPGWVVRSVLYYLNSRHGIQNLRLVGLRQGSDSRAVQISAGPETVPSGHRPQVVGWERDGTVAGYSVVLTTSLADQAVDLNLKLMRWRIMPELDLEKIASSKCLLLGAGTLGCYVARSLMVATGYDLSIPMPGHPIGSGAEQSVQETVAHLEGLIEDHDVVFLLMDSRESRWLPTVIGAARGKVVVNAALGFDSYLVMRHGVPATAGARLGCYFCNDIVAPTDNTRPNVHGDSTSVEAPAERAGSGAASACGGSPLGPVPHQVRGSLTQWNNNLVEGAAYNKCTACSDIAYTDHGMSFLLRAFNESGYLESVTGLDKLYAEAEAALDSVDWEEGSEEDDF
ncbi:hypothetical protein A1Q1_01437 [Trichosporon asahii var. asahii CBS 2479]|uniref:Ubiquitin-like modifier-activating enzyme ATG7 n=1 Tax=Trichosporon asahii var. asahii (strain ATCC 90039 / CBS 2479 / JCM 2466 / KCTC 7840 / NBRC 103889/ NCYC 2677 / UAMH 7654) TaxID=1186058 RepID=J4UDY6_TRIAS|nr:hypothetical protein A1Q1_01437 [Trichosporon asahii var. asahii CBS 2479]EJT49415.1 hypothetical protein A1Q1_01437 [Trichosporon asahii var. asahii CBS 2479]